MTDHALFVRAVRHLLANGWRQETHLNAEMTHQETGRSIAWREYLDADSGYTRLQVSPVMSPRYGIPCSVQVASVRQAVGVLVALDILPAEVLTGDPQGAALADANEQLGQALTEARAEVDGLRELVGMQWQRATEATARWRAEDPEARALIMPDLGDLLKWLMDDADRTRAELRDAKADIQSQASRLAELYDTVRGCAEALRGALAETDPDSWDLVEVAAGVVDDLDRLVSK